MILVLRHEATSGGGVDAGHLGDSDCVVEVAGVGDAAEVMGGGLADLAEVQDALQWFGVAEDFESLQNPVGRAAELGGDGVDALGVELDQVIEGVGFLDGRELAAADVFGGAHGGERSLVAVVDGGVDVGPAGHEGGTQSAVAGDELEALADGRHDDRIDLADFLELGGERCEVVVRGGHPVLL